MTETFTDARARTLEALSRIFDGDVDLLVALRSDEAALCELAESLGVDPEPLVRDASRADLQRSYDALFVVPGRRYVPPYASSHLTEPSEDAPPSPSAFARADGGRLGGEPAQRARAAYARFGFSPSRGDGMPDHLAAQLEFAARTDAAADDEVPAHARELAFAHLGWLERFERTLTQRDELGVYAGVASLATALVDPERARI